MKKKAEQGDKDAQCQLGTIFVAGNGVPKNTELGIQWLQKAAEQGSIEALNNLACMYYMGNGVPKNSKLAFDWFHKAAKLGHAHSQHNIAQFYALGTGVSQDATLAVEWYKKAAEQGFVLSQFHLGIMYQEGQGISQDRAMAVHWFKKAAKQGDMLAQRDLGLAYRDGLGVDKNPPQAIFWLTKAAEQGCTTAQHNLGMIYWMGSGVTRDAKLAVQWFKKAAEQGYAPAEHNMGIAYLLGQGVSQCMDTAALWFAKSNAHLDEAVANRSNLINKINREKARTLVKLGMRAADGKEGDKKNDELAFKHFLEAATLGSPVGQMNLAIMYHSGRGVEQDRAKAIDWFKRAAINGNKKAKAYLQTKADKGNQDAIKALQDINQYITIDLEEVEKAAVPTENPQNEDKKSSATDSAGVSKDDGEAGIATAEIAEVIDSEVDSKSPRTRKFV